MHMICDAKRLCPGESLCYLATATEIPRAFSDGIAHTRGTQQFAWNFGGTRGRGESSFTSARMRLSSAKIEIETRVTFPQRSINYRRENALSLSISRSRLRPALQLRLLHAHITRLYQINELIMLHDTTCASSSCHARNKREPRGRILCESILLIARSSVEIVVTSLLRRWSYKSRELLRSLMKFTVVKR